MHSGILKLTFIIIAASAIAFSFINPANAAVYLDISGTTANYNDEGVLDGAGLTLGWSFLDRYDFGGKTDMVVISQFAYRVDNPDTPLESTHSAIPVLCGVRYSYELYSMPLFVTGTAAAGATVLFSQSPKKTGPFYDPSKTVTLFDTGFTFTLRTGIVWVATQKIALFAEGGFNYVNCPYGFDAYSLSGFQFLAGARFTFAGSNNRLW